MNPYRRGVVLGLTVAETFILLFFLLLFLLFGFIHAAEYERDQTIEKLKEAHLAKETAIQDRNAAKRARDQTLEKLREARIAKETAIQARDISANERDRALEKLEEARIAEESAIQARKMAEHERDQARRSLSREKKGKNPPCWYKIIPDKGGGTRERPYYVFNVAIFEDSVALEQRTAPPGGAFDDGGGLYSEEWKRLDIGSLPYGKMLTDREFKDAVRDLVVQGKNQQVRTYKCVFSVMVWDKTPVHAKTRWKAAHDGVIEGLFNAYTVRDEKWRGIE